MLLQKSGSAGGSGFDVIEFSPSGACRRRTARSGGFVLLVAALYGGIVLMPPTVLAAKADLAELSLEELMNVEVTTVSKKRERRVGAADAVYVLTGEDIRRAGVTTIQDALRLVPGVQVARINSNQWAVGIRGFTSRLARSVLVLMDGRTLYDPLFTGTYWEIQDTAIEDIDRIEVIRGPGGALWGPDAFNGVINIITKDAAATQGALVMARAGNEERGTATARYGGAVNDKLFYRAYAKYLNRDGGHQRGPDFDEWWMARGGFRADWRPQSSDQVTLQGDMYDGRLGNRVNASHLSAPYLTTAQADVDVSGGNVLGRWTRAFSQDSEASLQSYYDHTFRRDLTFREERNSFDIDGQHRFHWLDRNELVWGMQYRVTADNTGGLPSTQFIPSKRTDHLVTGFAQNETTLIPQRLQLTLGIKLEHNDYSGFEYQPNARLLFTPLKVHTFWLSIGRSVRSPSRIEHDAELTIAPVNLDATNPSQCLPAGTPCVFPRLVRNRSFEAEEMLAYQLGYRVQPTSRLFLDVVGFYQKYDNLLSIESLTPFNEANPPPPHLVAPLIIQNKVHGESYGVEIAADAFLTDWWQLHPGYSYLNVNLQRDKGSTDTAGSAMEGVSPHNQFFLRSETDLPHDVTLDANVRYVDALPGPHVSSYLTLDARVGWNVTPQIELAAVGQNLTEPYHREFGGAGSNAVERSIYGQVRWHW